MRAELLARIESLLPTGGDLPELQRYAAMLRDYPQRGGKGLRSELLLGTARAYGVAEGSPEWERALWLAAALELFQNWVLIHDDIEDDSEERRGRPALHRLHGVPLAINAGDALHVYMWMAVRRSGVDQALDEFMAMVLKTAEGQHLDLAWVETREWNLTPEDYLRMVRLKTAYYTVIYPLRLGALAAGREPSAEFEAAGLALGTAFQIRDDVLNLIGDPAKYGKEIGGDLLEGKRTLIVLHWLAGASAQQRTVFLERMNRARTEKNAGQLEELLTWLRESGSVRAAQEFADLEAQRGLAALAQALAGAPNQHATEALLQTMKVLATRDA
ncbi:polyprenyl synthetase family protein [Deinococcus cavernae]|uniref:Polyprenyl synthetase family protein n=1 Tax=Deinococcus cavernae TaxID=2320857 RepID=A0A418V4M8_9DEIO|nr:polyprenyl synthetase family protein [Deinococcus cavernae]RJF71071.1 polyprenyl synthetase family protein [Deinococcus cavernae]